MANVTTDIAQGGTSIMDRLIRFTERLSKASSQYQEVVALSNRSDADLERAGTSRNDEVRRIFAHYL